MFYRFGPDGLKLRPAEPLPVVETEVPDEDDDDDFFGLDSDEDEEDDDSEDDTPLANAVPDSSDSAEEDEDEDEDEDVLGFGALLDIITGEDETATKRPKVTTPAPLLQFTIPILTKPTASSVSNSNVGGNVVAGTNSEELPNADEESVNNEADDESVDTDTTIKEATVTEPSNKIAKPDKAPTKKFTVSNISTKKPSVTSSSINAIENEANKKRKPLRKPVKGGEEDEDDDILGDSLDDDDDDDDDEEILSDDEDEDEKNSEEEEDEKNDESENHEDEDEKAELEDLDDDDEEEDAVISALVYDDKEDGKKKGKVKKHDQSSEADDDDSDYGLGLTGLLARNRNNRQSKEMRFPMIENSTLIVES